jgi:ATP-dependent protease HslVU (ClpYQ) peptidase subunit
MTCIVGIAKDGVVYMGGDRGASDDVTIVSISQPKVKVKGSWIYGYSGSLGNGQLFDLIDLPPVSKDEDPFRILRLDIVEELKSIIESHGSDKEDNATDFLIGCNGRLFEMSTSDWGVLEVSEVAVGSGGNFALGSLHTTHNLPIPIEDRIKLSLAAAITYSPTCQGPVDVLSI